MNSISVRVRRRFLHLFLATVLTCILVTLVSGTVLADTAGPVFGNIYPANETTVNQTKIIISLVAHDNDLVNFSSLVMKVDGATVSTIAQYAPIDESTDDYNTLEIYYPVTLTTGTHTVYVSVKDNQNNTSTKTWSFTVGQPPKVLSLSPANGATVVTRSPEITATVTSGNPIDPASIVMTLNNTPVPAVFDQVYGVISYTPTTPLEDESYYNVALSLKDTGGTAVNATWQFYVNTFREMDYTVDDSTCQTCHDRTKHPTNNCNKCHGINPVPNQPRYPLDDCYDCHFDVNTYPASYHTGGLPVSNPPNHPVQTTDSCVACHDQTWTGTTMPSIHNIFTTAVNHRTTTLGCTNCHATSLTREHQRRLDDQGNPLTCFTCHNNPDPNIQTAIANKDSSCAACHGLSAHPVHNNGLDANCQTCHSATVLEDTQFHANNDCAICHSSTNPLVEYNINNGDTNCVACHSEGHNINFVEKTPVDIPVYPDFEWSAPQQAIIWSGEPWFPAEFNSVGAKIIISNHRTDITGEALFDWYTQQLNINGWQKASGPDQGSGNFTLAYQKGSRRLDVIVYGGTTREPSSPFVGYRIELLYK